MSSRTSVARTLLAIAALCADAHGQNLAGCDALIAYQDDFWLAESNGAIVARITHDGQPKPAAALQPGGGLIAYSTLDGVRDLVLADASGRTVDRLATGANDMFTELKWFSPTLLRAAEHVGPTSSRFHFFSLAAGNRLLPTEAGQAAAGQDCAIGPREGQTACTVSDTVTLGDADFYYASDPFEAAEVVQSASLGLGTSLATNTAPMLRVAFKTEAPDSVTLRVTMPDNQWMEQRVEAGQTMTVMLDGGPLIGLVPTRTADPSVITLTVKKSKTGTTTFEGNVAWSPSGKRIAVVEANGAGQRSLVVLARQSGQAAIAGHGGVEGKLRLPIDGPVGAIKFLSDTSIRVEGARQAVEYTIPASGKLRSPAYAIKPLPPAGPMTVAIDGVNVLAEVRDWACT